MAKGLSDISWINIRNKTRLEALLDVRLEGLISHNGTKIRAANPDVDDRFDSLPGNAFPFARAHLIGEREDLVEFGLNIGINVLTIHVQCRGCSGRPAQGGVQNRAIFRYVDVGARKHRVDAILEMHLVS